MPADFTIKQGDTEPVLADQLVDSTNTPVNITGATVKFAMRALSAAAPATITGTVRSPDPVNGKVQWQPSAADTATAGMFMGNWVIVYANGQVQTYPTAGYIWISIEENLTTQGGQQLVGLPDVKDYLNIDHNDRSRDGKLVRIIHTVRPIVEKITGPIIPQVFDEWHDGGQMSITVRRRPSTGYGTSPILDLLGVDEYRGSTKYSLAVVPDPSQGSTYSVQVDRLGQITRRSAGGGLTPFFAAAQSVHVVYRSGQSTVPANVYEGTLELIRVNYQTTQSAGRGAYTVADAEDQQGPAMGFFMPRRVREMLAPSRRAPAVF